jgi:cytochrome c oxidase subunit 2
MATEVQGLRPSVPTTLRSPESVVRIRQLHVGLAALSSLSCGGPQSTLVTAGQDAARIADLFTVMTVGAGTVWAVVVGIAVYTIRVRESHSPRAANLLIIGGGVIAPTVLLGALIAYGIPLVPTVLALPPKGGLSIDAVAKQWWWRFQYKTQAGLVETAHELRLPVGQRVELPLSSPDVIHSFWVPSGLAAGRPFHAVSP